MQKKSSVRQESKEKEEQLQFGQIFRQAEKYIEQRKFDKKINTDCRAL